MLARQLWIYWKHKITVSILKGLGLTFLSQNPCSELLPPQAWFTSSFARGPCWRWERGEKGHLFTVPFTESPLCANLLFKLIISDVSNNLKPCRNLITLPSLLEETTAVSKIINYTTSQQCYFEAKHHWKTTKENDKKMHGGGRNGLFQFPGKVDGWCWYEVLFVIYSPACTQYSVRCLVQRYKITQNMYVIYLLQTRVSSSQGQGLEWYFLYFYLHPFFEVALPPAVAEGQRKLRFIYLR